MIHSLSSFLSQPFADPAAKKKYTEASYGPHVLTTARNLVGSTLFGIAMTLGLHYYRGMVMGLAMQAVMGPLNLAENALVKALFVGQGFSEEDRIFEEKLASELTADDEVVDGEGNPVVLNIMAAGATGGAMPAIEETKSLEDILLDTWDAGAKADLSDLMSALTKKNCNHQTKEDQWTALMILSGLVGVAGTTSAIRQVQNLGANSAIVDKEGWTPLHWAAFHGSIDAAKELVKKEARLLSVLDKEGHTALETAKSEGNDAVAAVYEQVLGDSKKSK
jgi:hypothetical protein